MKEQNCDDYNRIEHALLYLEKNAAQQPSLRKLAHEIHLSDFHFQRLFKRWAGITPKRFLQIVTVELAKESLSRSRNVLEASWDAGLSGPGRLHDLFVAIEAVTPGEFKSRGEGLTIRYGFHDTRFGRCLIGMTSRGICHLSFYEHGRDSSELKKITQSWPAAKLAHEQKATSHMIARIFHPSRAEKIPLLVAGTNFQAKVWNAMIHIPSGKTVTYSELARTLGKPRAARAVGSAVATNSIAYLIPCHRVIRSMGAIGQYRWGPSRKKVMLAWEAASASHTPQRQLQHEKQIT